VRPLDPTDAPAIAALLHRAFAVQEVPTDPPSGALQETGASIAAVIAAGGGAAIFDAATPIACVLWQVKDGGLHLGRLAVDPAHRGRGHARALIAVAEAHARARNLPRVWLSTRLVLAANRALFAACGFAEGAARAHPGYVAPTSIEMSKSLAR
jgi:ribosomal protein S18 acetylase RimI-like enzyme